MLLSRGPSVGHICCACKACGVRGQLLGNFSKLGKGTNPGRKPGICTNTQEQARP